VRDHATPAGVGWYRRDITGLRSLAIIPVVAFHAGATFIPGGFIGVDIFYVISGFLITTLLVREWETTGRIRLGDFWAKRIRRLAPALIVVIAITLPVGALLASVLSWDTLAMQATASAFYVANILFWRESTDYFDTGGGQSPFLHMWSLGVEEQFYIVWPLLIIGTAVFAARRVTLRWRLAVVFGTVFVVSLVSSVVLTPINPNAAFYLLPTRAWEFAGAGLLALIPHARLALSARAASMVGLSGVAILLFGFGWLSDADLYPGHLALIPFTGTVLIIISGTARRSVLAPVLESSPAVWIGNVSYSWYLWHWPLIVFAGVVLPENWGASAAAGAVALGAGALSYHFVERPLRYARFVTASLFRTYALGAAATVLVIAIAGTVAFTGGRLLAAEPWSTYEAAAETLPKQGCDANQRENFGAMEACVLGDPAGSRTVAVIGDSHAGHWREAMDDAAMQAGLRLLFRGKSSCPSLDVVVGDSKGVQDPECASFREETMDLLEAARPDAVVISNAFAYDGKLLDADGSRLSLEEERTQWRRGLEDQVDAIRAIGAHVALVVDNPRMLFNPTACISRLGHAPEECTSSRGDAHKLIADFGEVTEHVIADRAILSTFSTDDLICDTTLCYPVDSAGRPIYQDQTHLSRMWTASQVPMLVPFLREVAAAQPR
jgi:peptidoglycan/LPS O-acetylase OafA/YrhL